MLVSINVEAKHHLPLRAKAIKLCSRFKNCFRFLTRFRVKTYMKLSHESKIFNSRRVCLSYFSEHCVLCSLPCISYPHASMLSVMQRYEVKLSSTHHYCTSSTFHKSQISSDEKPYLQ